MKDSKEKEHRISNLKDMINNVTDDETSYDDIEEDSELIDYLNHEKDFDNLEIDDEFIYHPGENNVYAVNLEENPIDEDFIINTPNPSEESRKNKSGEYDEFDDEITGEISEGFDSIMNAKIGRTPVIGMLSSILGLLLIVVSAIILSSRSDKVVDNVISGESSFMSVIFAILGLLLLIYGLYKVIGFKNPLSNVVSNIDNIDSENKKQEKSEIEGNVIPKSNIPLDKESYKIGEFNFKDLKKSLKKPNTLSKPAPSPREENIEDIPPAKERPDSEKGLTAEEIDELEYQKVTYDSESIDDIFAEVEDIEDIEIISEDIKEER
jgi:hypothetical protein